MWEYNQTNYLCHHGVKGQKWGVRRYRNSDGTITPAGKKHYDKMSDDKLQKNLYKQVKKARSEQTNPSNQWNVYATVGKNSKEALDKYKKALEEHKNSDKYKSALKKFNDLDRRFDSGKISIEQYDREVSAIQKSIYRADLDSSVRYGRNGREYTKAYLDKYGKDLNVAYLKDLGYDEKTSKEFTERVLKANKKMLNGM